MSKKDCQKRQVCFAVGFAHCFETSQKTEFLGPKINCGFCQQKNTISSNEIKTREIKYIFMKLIKIT